MRKFLLAAFAAMMMAFGCSGLASAQTFSGNTTGQPEFGGPFPSIILPFYTNVSGLYTFYQSSPTIDTYFLLYRDVIDPADPDLGLYGGNDDGDPDDGLNSRLTIGLDARRQYYAVLGAFDGNETGPVRLDVTGPAVGTFALLPIAAVPEPAAWTLMIAGFGATGGMLRRRRTAALA